MKEQTYVAWFKCFDLNIDKSTDKFDGLIQILCNVYHYKWNENREPFLPFVLLNDRSFADTVFRTVWPLLVKFCAIVRFMQTFMQSLIRSSLTKKKSWRAKRSSSQFHLINSIKLWKCWFVFHNIFKRWPLSLNL